MDDPETAVNSIDDSDGEFFDCKPENDIFTTTSRPPYTDLINDLMKTHPNPRHGHFESYAHAVYCKNCRMVLQPDSARRIPCKRPEFTVLQDGIVICVHDKCEKLNLTEHVRSVANECGSWKKTYWRLWSECHFLSCTACKWQYPVTNSATCQYHPDPPEYFPIENSGLEQPIGRYPCCGERAFRFQLFKNPFGCKFRMHEPSTKNDQDACLVDIMQTYPEWIIAEPPSLNFEEKIMKFVYSKPGTINRSTIHHWWVKMTLGENRCTRPSIISPCLIDNGKKKKKNKDSKKWKKRNIFELHKQSNFKQTKLISQSKNETICSASSDDYSELQKLSLNRKYSWRSLTALISIQDLQREHENNIFKQIIAHYNKSAKGDKCLSGTLVQPRDNYNKLYANLLEKINANNKTALMKKNNTLEDKKNKLHNTF